jgi:hypothetical protein
MARDAVPLFESVTVWAGLVDPTTWPPKVRPETDNETLGVPGGFCVVFPPPQDVNPATANAMTRKSQNFRISIFLNCHPGGASRLF